MKCLLRVAGRVDAVELDESLSGGLLEDDDADETPVRLADGLDHFLQEEQQTTRLRSRRPLRTTTNHFSVAALSHK